MGPHKYGSHPIVQSPSTHTSVDFSHGDHHLPFLWIYSIWIFTTRLSYESILIVFCDWRLLVQFHFACEEKGLFIYMFSFIRISCWRRCIYKERQWMILVSVWKGFHCIPKWLQLYNQLTLLGITVTLPFSNSNDLCLIIFLWCFFSCDLKVVSDSNLFYIKTILQHYKIYNCFSEIITNPALVDEQGRLRIFPYHKSHDCHLCPSNLCKVTSLVFCSASCFLL